MRNANTLGRTDGRSPYFWQQRAGAAGATALTLVFGLTGCGSKSVSLCTPGNASTQTFSNDKYDSFDIAPSVSVTPETDGSLEVIAGSHQAVNTYAGTPEQVSPNNDGTTSTTVGVVGGLSEFTMNVHGVTYNVSDNGQQTTLAANCQS